MSVDQANQDIPDPDTEGEAAKGHDSSHGRLSSRLAPSGPPVSGAHQNGSCNKEKDWWDKRKRWFEIGGFVLLLFYTIYTIRMYYANKEAADAARAAANIASQALKSSNDSFQTNERAWIGVTSANSSEVQPDAKTTIFLTISNTGKTPGIIEGGMGGCKLEVRYAPVPKDETYPSSRKRSRMVLFPNGFLTIVQRYAGEAEMSAATATIQATHFMTKREFSIVRSGKARLVAHGVINYIDAFQRRHFTEFCFQWDRDSPPTWEACPEHNNAD